MSKVKSAGAAQKGQVKSSSGKAGKKLQKVPKRSSSRKLTSQPTTSQDSDSDSAGEGEMAAPLSSAISPPPGEFARSIGLDREYNFVAHIS